MSFTTCAHINLDHLADNIRAIGQKVKPARVIPVVKADAYGHGALPVVRRLLQEGYDMFAVAHLKEAMELRDSGIARPILIFGRLFPDEIPQAIQAGFRITLACREDVDWIRQAGQDLPAYVHVNIETGMGRIGLFVDQDPGFFDCLTRSGCCIWEGLYSHFATADETDRTYADLQLSRFQNVVSLIRKYPGAPRMIHMANSGAVLGRPDSYFDAVRTGILMYGHYPSAQALRTIPVRQVMTLKTFVAHIRRIPERYPVSYGRQWMSAKNTKIAVLPLGYADGVCRRMTNTGQVLIQGRRYPMVGTITMDHTMVDIGEDPVTVGDEVILWGESSHGTLQAGELAEKIGTIPYELTCGVSRRIRRVYTGDHPESG
ncbi:MAG: alanine racemase [Desulfobacterales bacterium]|nr:alanine racemase [Desulfobacterales bacterium]